MKMLRAIVRPEMAGKVSSALLQSGFPAMTKMDVYGRGKQLGLKIGDMFYDELPKEMLMVVVEDADEEKVSDIIMRSAHTGNDGNFGDGRIFVTDVVKAYTISTKSEKL